VILQQIAFVDSPQSPKEDSGLIDIVAMQQKAHDAKLAALAAEAARPIVPAPLSEPPPAVSRDTGADLAEFGAAMRTSWTKKVRPSWIAGGVGALIAIFVLVSIAGGSKEETKAAAVSAAANVPAAPPPAPEPPKAIPPAPAPVAAAAPEPSKEMAKPASRKRAKAKKPAGSKLQKISSSGVAS
jgi:hypothetical protein